MTQLPKVFTKNLLSRVFYQARVLSHEHSTRFARFEIVCALAAVNVLPLRAPRPPDLSILMIRAALFFCRRPFGCVRVKGKVAFRITSTKLAALKIYKAGECT